MLLLGVFFGLQLSLTRLQQGVLALGIAWTFGNLGGLTEGRAWARGSEFVRLGVLGALAVLGARSHPGLGALAGLHAALALWLARLPRR
jgi:hypothetical protein